MPSLTEAPSTAKRARLMPFVGSAVAVLFVGLAAHVLESFVSLPHVSVLFLAPVVMSAALWGLWPAVLAALLSVAAGSYFFYSPIFDFRVASPQDVADLAVFLIVAMFTSRLAANVRTRGLEARRRQERLSRLLEFTNRLSAASTDTDLRAAIVDSLATVIRTPIHLLESDGARLSVVASSPAADVLPEEIRAAAGRVVEGADSQVPGWRIERLEMPQGVVAVIAAREVAFEEEPDYVRALLGQAAQALERERLHRDIGEARLKMQGEALREALLSSISHDLQTPLAGILGSVTALQTISEQSSPGTRAELLATIREEAERLTAHIENVLDLTRIRAGQVSARLELIELADIINAALLRKHRQLRGHELQLRIPPDLPMLRLDLFLMEHAIGAVLDNAAKYAPPGSKVMISAMHEAGTVVLDVSDAGSGIPADDLPHVFDAFYRGASSGRPASGTGLGLAICRAFVEANGGAVEICRGGTDRGTTVRFRLPASGSEAISQDALRDE